MIFLALTLHALVPASSAVNSKPQAAPTTPKPSPQHTVRPRKSDTPSPRPTSTNPYPGGVSQPQGAGDGAFFVSDTGTPSSGASSFLWIALAVLGLGLVIRWFFIAARNQDSA